MNTHKNKSSKFERLLWWVAGAVPSILKHCPTEYTKYASLGIVILMTAGCAFCSGTFAAWYFSCGKNNPTGNLFAAIIFGIIWSFLIFCIDRCLVVTLKKKKDQRRFWWFPPFIVRFLLASLIAIIISIPLELFLFRDYINSEGLNRDSQKISTYKNNYSQNDEIKVLDAEKGQLKIDMNEYKNRQQSATDAVQKKKYEIDKLLAMRNNPRIYSKECKLIYDDYIKAYNSYKLQKRQTRKKRVEYDYSRKLYRQLMSYESIWRNKKDQEIDRKKKDLENLNIYLISITNELNRTNERYNKKSNASDALLSVKSSKVKELDEKLESENTFIRNFDILEWAISSNNPQNNGKMADEGYFLWLIRSFLLIIEIMPTVTRIAMPYGAYDELINKYEKNEINNTIEDNTEDEDTLKPFQESNSLCDNHL